MLWKALSMTIVDSFVSNKRDGDSLYVFDSALILTFRLHSVPLWGLDGCLLLEDIFMKYGIR